MPYNYINILPLFLLTGCGIVPDNIVTFCGPYDHGFIALNKNNNTYYKGFSQSYDQNLYKKLDICSDDNNICINGPFYLNIRKNEYGKIIEKNNSVNIKFEYSKKEGLTKITIIFDINKGKLGDPHANIVYEKCPLEFDRFYLNEYL
jgi:hypothetical protein